MVLPQGKKRRRGIKNPATQHLSSLREVKGKRPFSKSLQEGKTEDEKQDKGKKRRRRRHTPHKHIGQNKAKEEKSKMGNREGSEQKTD